MFKNGTSINVKVVEYDEKKVWSVTINGQNDCVVMTETEAAMVTLKFSGDPEIYDMIETSWYEPRISSQNVSYD